MGKSCAAVDADPRAGSEATGSAAGAGELDQEQAWLESWAFATSPYGLGLSPSISWLLTPREFQALEQVYGSHLERWGVERAWFANAHFKKEDGSRFDADDFVNVPSARRSKKQQQRSAERQKQDMIAIAAEEDKHIRMMNAAKHDPLLTAKLERALPAWARMTDEEKQARGLLN